MTTDTVRLDDNPDASILALRVHDGQRDDDGQQHFQHVQRVATTIGFKAPKSVQTVAWLHDVLEDVILADRLRLRTHLEQMLAPEEMEALLLLTRSPDDTYAQYVEKIATATGEAGDIARRVKEADLLDNLSRSIASGAEGRITRYRRALAVMIEGSTLRGTRHVLASSDDQRERGMQATTDQETYEGIAQTLREIGHGAATAAVVRDVHQAARDGRNIPHGETGRAAKLYVIAAVQNGSLEGGAAL